MGRHEEDHTIAIFSHEKSYLTSGHTLAAAQSKRDKTTRYLVYGISLWVILLIGGFVIDTAPHNEYAYFSYFHTFSTRSDPSKAAKDTRSLLQTITQTVAWPITCPIKLSSWLVKKALGLDGARRPMTYSVEKIAQQHQPLPRSSHGLSVYKNQLFVFGGENVARVPIGSQLHSLDLASPKGSWKEVKVVAGSVPPPRVAHSQVLVDDSIYIFGGRQGVQMEEVPLNDVYHISLSSTTPLKWEKVETSGDVPSKRSFHGMCSGKTVDGYNAIFVFGGCGATGRMSDVYELNLATLTWVKLPSFDKISGRGGASFFYSNGFLYVVGGFNGNELNDAYSFNLSTKKWRKEKVTGTFRPRSVCAHSSFSRNGTDYLAIFGGEVNPSEKGHEGAGGFASDLLLLPVDSNTGKLEPVKKVNLIGDAATSRGWTAMAPTTKGLVIFGGLTGSDEDPVRLDDTISIEVYDD